MNARCQNPGNRVGDVQAVQRVLHLEDGEDPDNTERAGAGQRYQHRHDRIAHAADAAHHDVHQAAQEIGRADIAHTGDAVGNNLRVGGVDAQQLLAQQVSAAAQQDADRRHDAQALEQDFVDTAKLLGAHVLAGEAQRGLVDRVHRVVDKALDVAGSGVARHDLRTKGVDRGLDQHVGKAEYDTLQARRQADAQHLAELVEVEFQVLKVQMAGALHLHQAQQNQNRRNGLGNDGRQRDARNAHVEYDDKEQVQKDVDDAGQGQKVKRALGVADRPEDGRAKVVKHEGRHPHKVDAHIQHRLVDDIVRGAHQLQQRARQSNTDKDQKDAADQGGQNRGMYRAMYAVIVPRAVVARNHNVRADRDADKQVDNQVDQRAGGADRRHRLAAGKASDNHDVRRVEQKLQNAGDHQRDGKDQDLAQKRTAAHIHFV